jgi:DNA-binding response OmpR family regulator
MLIAPSCPVLVVHDDGAFRRALIAALDRNHFTVTVHGDGAEAIRTLQERPYRMVVLGLDVRSGRGRIVLDFLRENRQRLGCGLLLVADPDPALRESAGLADETLMKPVDAEYVARRARIYCGV